MLKKVFIGVILTPLVICSLFVALLFINPVVNNIRLGFFASQINEGHLPEKTVIVEKEASCGKLNGNGNGMDYLSATLIKSELSMDKLKQHFLSIPYRPARIINKYDVEIEVLPAMYMLESLYYERGEIYFEELRSKKDYSGYYIVIIYDGGYSSGFDIRGH